MWRSVTHPRGRSLVDSQDITNLVESGLVLFHGIKCALKNAQVREGIIVSRSLCNTRAQGKTTRILKDAIRKHSIVSWSSSPRSRAWLYPA